MTSAEAGPEVGPAHPASAGNSSGNDSSDIGRAYPREDGIRIVYIMGYGRSGSTLLDVMLGCHADITGVGEISYLSEWLADNKQCACHYSIRECDFWSRVFSESNLSLGEESLSREVDRSVESRRALPRLLAGRLPENMVARYRRSQAALFAAVASVAENRVIVDSSKSVHRTDGRALALQRYTDLDVRVIHLVRDARAVTWSALKGPGGSEKLGYTRVLPPLLRGLWVVADWTITNLVCLVLARRLTPRSVIRVRYEDLVRNPRSELARIGAFVGVNLTDVSEMISLGQPLSPGHNVGGNRLTSTSAIRLKEDREWQDKLPWIYRGFYWLLAWPVAGRLGYRIGRR
ncbi:sulfotransferase [Gemmatimonadota bacterium]